MKSSLRTKILLIASIVVVVAMLANALTSSYFFTRKQTESRLMWADAIARVLGGQLERILFLDIPIEDLQGFERQCEEAVARNTDLSYAYVVSADGAMLFHNAQSAGAMPAVPRAVLDAISAEQGVIEQLDDDSHAVTVPVMDPRGVRVAHVVVGFPAEIIREARSSLLALTAGVDLLVFGLSMVLLLLALSRFVIRPLTAIVRTLERIRPGDTEQAHRLKNPGSEELDVMVGAFNRLLERLSQHESELVAAKEAAERADRAKSDFLAVMSHEIRTPMHAMLGMTEMLAKTALDSRQNNYVIRLLRSGRALLSIINDILDFSRIDAGQTELEDIAFDLRGPFCDVVDTLTGSAADKGLLLTLQCPSLPLGVRGDPVRLSQIAMNLVSNAIKFTDKGTITVRVRAEDSAPAQAGERTRLLILEVVDTGIGISQEAQAQIFNPFSQADSSITRRYGGSGLGLSIVERIVRLMQGEISVISSPGKGSTFTVRIPFVPAAVLPVEEAAGHSTADAALAGVRVLLVEDDPVNQEVANAMLEDSGVIVTIANNGNEAVEAIGRERFDLVFMDCHMPICDGFEATARIRRSEAAGAHLPIIALTADILPETRHRCRNAGMDDFLAKPFSQLALLAAIRRWTDGTAAAPVVERTQPGADDELPLFDPAPLERLATLRNATEKRLVEKTLELFLTGLDELMPDIERAKAASDAKALAAIAHQLKSSSANVGAAKLSACAAALEKSARQEASFDMLTPLADTLSECATTTAVVLQCRLELCRQGDDGAALS